MFKGRRSARAANGGNRLNSFSDSESFKRFSSAAFRKHNTNGSNASRNIAAYLFRPWPNQPRIWDSGLVCNRYRLTHSKQYLAERFQASDEIEERPRYNIAPTQPVVTVRKEHGRKTRKFTTMRWGLIPSWAKDTSIGTRTLNARSERVTTTPAFRQSILTKRCLIPADGFYEWQKMGSVKQPYCFEVNEGDVFAFAGLWDQWKSPDGQIIESCTILTTTPNSLVADLHDRMPVIVPPDKYDANLMRRYPVSRKLNNSRIDDAESGSPVILDMPAQSKLF